MSGDAGLDVLKGIFELLKIDDEWSSWSERGFEWWAHNLRQRVWVSPGYDDEGITIYRFFAVSDAIRAVKKPQSQVDGILGELNSVAVASAMVFDPSEESVKFWTAATVHEDNAEWMTRLLTSCTILQAIEATRRAESFATILDGEPDYSGSREEPDEMLTVLDTVFLPQGQNASPWRGSAEMTQIRDMLNQANCVSMGDEIGLTAEFPFGDATSMMQVKTDEDNPTIGSGVGMFLQLPMWGTAIDAAKIAGALNRAEANSKTQSHLIGSWCVKTVGEQSIPAFASFIPTSLFQPGILTNLMLSAVGRAMWVGQLLNPDTTPADVASVMAERYGVMAEP